MLDNDDNSLIYQDDDSKGGKVMYQRANASHSVSGKRYTFAYDAAIVLMKPHENIPKSVCNTRTMNCY